MTFLYATRVMTSPLWKYCIVKCRNVALGLSLTKNLWRRAVKSKQLSLMPLSILHSLLLFSVGAFSTRISLKLS